MKETVMQFGEGGFLRGFVDYFFKKINDAGVYEGKVVVVQPIETGMTEMLNAQNGEYNLYLRGIQNGEVVNEHTHIDVISRAVNPYKDFDAYMEIADNPDLRVIVSNTTEAGIEYLGTESLEDRPAKSYPAKLTQFLYRRFKNGLRGFILLPCELIDHNADTLKEYVLKYADLWQLGEEFKNWLLTENDFCNTLVDRIVTGYPRNEAEAIWKELGYEDQLLDTGEIFGAWVIEGPQAIKEEFPFEKAGLPIMVVDDVTPYKQRKVRILNGAHTSFVLGAFRSGQDIVRDCMEDEVINAFMKKTLYDEVIPTLDLPEEDLMSFASAVSERFANPYIDHELLSISLNSTSKWRARCMPSLLEYARRNGGKLPPCLTFSFAAYIDFYRSGEEKGEGCLKGRRGEMTYEIKDDQWVLDLFHDLHGEENTVLAHAITGNEQMWGEELRALPGFEEEVVKYLDLIDEIGVYEAMKQAADL